MDPTHWPYTGGPINPTSMLQAQAQHLPGYPPPIPNTRQSKYPKQKHLASQNSAKVETPPDPSKLGLEEQKSSTVEGRSEPVEDQTDGLPDLETFDDVIDRYLRNLSIRKQDKALIPAKRAEEIKKVLEDPKTTAVQTPQFRFWVKKMFALKYDATEEYKPWVYNNNKPIAVREKLYKILVHAHRECAHGGRDKTSQEVRNYYSWVPKELIAQFVKVCPTCQHRRNIPRSESSDADDGKMPYSNSMMFEDPEPTIKEDDDDTWVPESLSLVDQEQSPSLNQNHMRSFGESLPSFKVESSEPPYRYGGTSPRDSIPTWDHNLHSYHMSPDDPRYHGIGTGYHQYDHQYNP